MDRIHKYRDQFYAAMYLDGDGYRYSRIVDVKGMVGEAIAKGTLEAVVEAEQLLCEYLKGVFIDSFMHDARKTWIPGGHEGSQSSSGGALRLLAKATVEVLDKERAEWMEEMGEDADEAEYLE